MAVFELRTPSRSEIQQLSDLQISSVTPAVLELEEAGLYFSHVLVPENLLIVSWLWA